MRVCTVTLLSFLVLFSVPTQAQEAPTLKSLETCSVEKMGQCAPCQKWAEATKKDKVALRTLAESDLPQAWRCALSIMEHQGATEAAIEQLLQKNDRKIRRNTIVLAGNTQIRGSGWRILKFAQQEVDSDDEAILLNAIAALGQLKHEEALPFLIKMAGDPRPKIQRVAMRALGFFETNEVIRLLAVKAKDEEAQLSVRSEAIGSLGRMQDRYALKVLVGLLNSVDTPLKTHIITALGRTGNRRVLPHLLPLLEDEELAEAVVETLGRLRNKKGATALMSLYNNEERDGKLRGKALFAAARTGAAQAYEPLIDLLKNGRKRHRTEIITALGWLKDSRAVPHLYGLYKKADEGDKELLLWAMRQCSGKALMDEEAIKTYIESQQD